MKFNKRDLDSQTNWTEVNQTEPHRIGGEESSSEQLVKAFNQPSVILPFIP